MLMYFNPLCDICRYEMKQLIKNASYFKNKQIILVSPENIVDIKKFAGEFNLQKYANIKILYDKNDTLYKVLKPSGYPAIYIFNSDKQIINSFEGETGIDEIKNAFQPDVAIDKDNRTPPSW
jgi:hypothetical protein